MYSVVEISGGLFDRFDTVVISNTVFEFLFYVFRVLRYFLGARDVLVLFEYFGMHEVSCDDIHSA